MECDICLQEWTSKDRVPRFLSCGHTFCEECLISLVKKYNTKNENFKCPSCQTVLNLRNEDDVKSLAKNYNLIRLVEKTDEGFDKKEKTEDTSLKFNINNKCPKHFLPFYSYIKSTNQLLCQKCLEKHQDKDIVLLPETLSKLKYLINKSELKSCFTKNEIAHLKEFLESFQENFEKDNRKKLDDLFRFYHEIINDFYNNFKQLLEKYITEQKNSIAKIIDELNVLRDQLTIIENDLTDIENSHTELQNIEKIRKTSARMINFLNYDHEFTLYSMKIEFNQSEQDNLFAAIQKSMNINVDNLMIKGELPTIGKILDNDLTWPCICGSISNKKEDIKCSSCGLLRRLETFDTEDENYKWEIIKYLNKRRAFEKQEFQQILKNNDEEYEFIIDKTWYNQWERYLNYEEEFPPGKIDNSALAKKLSQGNSLRDEEFSLVSKSAWDFFYLNYNGGPVMKKNLKGETVIVNKKIENYTSVKEQYFTDSESEDDSEVIYNSDTE